MDAIPTSRYTKLILTICIFISAIVSLFSNTEKPSDNFITLSFTFLITTNIVCLLGLRALKMKVNYGNNYTLELIEVSFACLTNIIIFANIYCTTGLKFDGGVVHSVRDSLYFSIITWTTVGYGDFTPVPELRIVTATEALLGYFYMAILIGSLMLSFTSKKQE